MAKATAASRRGRSSPRRRGEDRPRFRRREGHERLDAAPPRPDLALEGADGASAMALQPPPHLLTTLPAPAGGGRCVCPADARPSTMASASPPGGFRLEPGSFPAVPLGSMNLDPRCRILVEYAKWTGLSAVKAPSSATRRSASPTPRRRPGKVAPSWGGQASSGAEALWGRETMAGMAQGNFKQGNRLDGEVGYGLPVGSRFVGTPRVGFSTSEYGRDYRVGYALGVLDREGLKSELGVDAQRREGPMLGRRGQRDPSAGRRWAGSGAIARPGAGDHEGTRRAHTRHSAADPRRTCRTGEPWSTRSRSRATRRPKRRSSYDRTADTVTVEEDPARCAA